MSVKSTSQHFAKPEDVDLSKIIYKVPKTLAQTFSDRVNMYYETEGNYMVFNIVGYSEHGIGYWKPKDQPDTEFEKRNYRITYTGPEKGWYVQRRGEDNRTLFIVKIENNQYVEIPPENYTPRTKVYLDWMRLLDKIYMGAIEAVLADPLSKKFKRTIADILISFPCRAPEKSTDPVTGGPLENNYFRITTSHQPRLSKAGKPYDPTAYFNFQGQSVKFMKYYSKSAECLQETMYCPTSCYFCGKNKEAYVTSRGNQLKALSVGCNPEKRTGGSKYVETGAPEDIYKFDDNAFDYKMQDDEEEEEEGEEKATKPESPSRPKSPRSDSEPSFIPAQDSPSKRLKLHSGE